MVPKPCRYSYSEVHTQNVFGSRKRNFMIQAISEKFEKTQQLEGFDRLLTRCNEGCPKAHNELSRLVHADFYRIAKRLVSGHRFQNSMHATNLVNETFLRMLKGGVFQKSENSDYLFGTAARIMRHVIADYLRRNKAAKRSPSGSRIYLDRLIDKLGHEDFKFENLNEALNMLENTWPRQAEIVNMRFFFGMTVPEIAVALGVSESTVEKDWQKARCWLFKQLKE